MVIDESIFNWRGDNNDDDDFLFVFFSSKNHKPLSSVHHQHYLLDDDDFHLFFSLSVSSSSWCFDNQSGAIIFVEQQQQQEIISIKFEKLQFRKQTWSKWKKNITFPHWHLNWKKNRIYKLWNFNNEKNQRNFLFLDRFTFTHTVMMITSLNIFFWPSFYFLEDFLFGFDWMNRIIDWYIRHIHRDEANLKKCFLNLSQHFFFFKLRFLVRFFFGKKLFILVTFEWWWLSTRKISLCVCV